jgi:hypothetical protein
LFGKCAEDRRVLVTLDLDFADPLRFPPAGGPGTMVHIRKRHRIVVQGRALNASLRHWVIGRKAGP